MSDVCAVKLSNIRVCLLGYICTLLGAPLHDGCTHTRMRVSKSIVYTSVWKYVHSSVCVWERACVCALNERVCTNVGIDYI